jgi:uncharacterized membrane protein
MNIVTFLVAGYFGLADHAAGLMWAGLCILAAVLPPTIFYRVRLRQGTYGDEDISIRQQRNELYLVGFVWALVIAIALFLLGAPRSLLALMLVGMGLGLIGARSSVLEDQRTLCVDRHNGDRRCSRAAWGWRCNPALAVGWARVRTGNHRRFRCWLASELAIWCWWYFGWLGRAVGELGN